MYYVVESVQGECVNSQVDQVFDTIKPSCDLITFFLTDNRCQVLDCVCFGHFVRFKGPIHHQIFLAE